MPKEYDDLGLGRYGLTAASGRTVSLSVGAQVQLATPNPARIALIIGPPSVAGSGLYIYFGEVASNIVIARLVTGGPNLVLTGRDFGEVVRRGFFGLSDTNNEIIGVVETFLV